MSGGRTGATRSLFRIVQGASPTLADFMSYASLGKPSIGQSLEHLKRRTGISVFETEEQARRRASDLPYLGSHIARLEVPIEWNVESTGSSGRGHHTIYGQSPEALLACVTKVFPVE